MDTGQQFSVSVSSRLTLSDLSSHGAFLSPDVLGRDVKARFIEEPELPGIAIVSESGNLVGLVSRKLFMELFSKPYRKEIYSNKKAVNLMREIGHIPLVFGVDAMIDDVASAIIARSSADFSEPVVLQLGQGQYRVVDCQVVLSALAQSYADQYHKLQVAKDTIVENEKLASLGSLVAGVAHEINTPLGIGITAISSILDQVEELQRHFESGQIKRSDLKVALSCMRSLSNTSLRTLNHAAELVRSFKQVSADQVSEARRVFELGEELNHIVNSLRPLAKSQDNKEIELVLEVGHALIMNSFPGALSQVVTNLIVNAFKHAFDKVESGIVTLRYHAEGGGFVKIQVQDSGQGIPKENLERIFEPFFTTKRGIGGTGLGLSIVHNLTRSALGGSISVHLPEEGGACFTIVIPMSIAEGAGETRRSSYRD